MNAHTPKPPHALLAKRMDLVGDPEIHAMFAELIGDEPAAPTLAQISPTAIEQAEAYLSRSYRTWNELYERSFSLDLAGGDHEVRMSLLDARHNMQAAQQNLADVVEITAIGDIGNGWVLRPGYMCLDLCRDESDENEVLRIPRGLSGHVVRTIIGAYSTGCIDGGNAVRDQLSSIMERQRR